MSPAEQEVVNLCIAWEALSDIANHQLLELHPVADSPGQSTVTFPSRVHQSMFLIRLLDFVKERGAAQITGVNASCLDLLGQVRETRTFDIHGSVHALLAPAAALRSWMDELTPVDLWLSTIELQARLEVPRETLLFIAGNIVKHNLSRLTGVSHQVHRLLEQSGYRVDPAHVPLALEDFPGHLNEDLFVSYGSWIAELVNEVLWGMYLYLRPTYANVYRDAPEVGDGGYRFELPAEIANPVARAWLWRLMNHVRATPPIPRFVAPNYMKQDFFGRT